MLIRYLLVSFTLMMWISITAQKTPEIYQYRIRVLYEDRIVQAEIKPVKRMKDLNFNLRYAWYASNQINFTQGGFSGKLLNGYYSEYYRSKSLRAQGSYSEGLKDGTWKAWDEKGNLIERLGWKNGLRNGVFQTFDTVGKIKEEGTYKKDLLHGALKKYKGDSLEVILYKDGSPSQGNVRSGFLYNLFKARHI